MQGPPRGRERARFSNDANVTFNNLSGATFAINTASDFFGGTINNAGTITKTSGGGDGITRITATLNNTNAINVNSGALTLENGGAHTGSFLIMGAARLEFGGGTHTLSAPASISGGGTMSFAAGTTSFNAGTYNVTGATRCSSGTHTFLGAASVTSVGTLEIVGGTLNFSSGELITTTAYTQSSGTLTGTDTLTVSGLLTWSGRNDVGPRHDQRQWRPHADQRRRREPARYPHAQQYRRGHLERRGQLQQRHRRGVQQSRQVPR